MHRLALLLFTASLLFAAPAPAQQAQPAQDQPQQQQSQSEQPPQQQQQQQPADQSAQQGEAPSPDSLSTSDPEALGNQILNMVGGSNGQGDGQAQSEGETFDITKIDASQLANDLAPRAVSILLDILAVIGILIVGIVLGGWLRRVVRSGLLRARVEQTIAQFTGNIVRWAIIVLALLMCLAQFGINVTSIAALIGAAALTIGLAFQGSLSNIAAGVMLLIFRPFKVGEWVELDGELGVVTDIDLFYTHIDQFDNKHVILPNSSVLENKVESLTHNPQRRVHVEVGVAYGSDLVATREALTKAAHDPALALDDRDPMIILTGFGDSSINWEVRVWGDSREFLNLRDQVVEAIDNRLKEAGITIPFPQRDLNTNQPLRIRLEKPDSDDED
ncbi:MAG: mechanosensitive ion channel domain-containing protein [Planctomycetota bacterium]|nr:mechanosensitive ion channel domain-containing protein [Planctomycetota bacterium]